MCIKKAVAKLAAAAVLAAGGAWMIGTAVADDVRKGPVELGVSFLIETNDTAVIEVAVDNSPTREILETKGLALADAGENNPGSLGILKVTTNASDGWDISMTTKYGGKLVYVGNSEPDPDHPVCPSGSTEILTGWDRGKCDAGSGNVVEKVPGTILGSVQSLVYNGEVGTGASGDGWRNDDGSGSKDSPNDTVQLVVKIGLCDKGSDMHASASPDLYYAWGAPDYTDDYGPVQITADDLLASRQYDHDGGANTPTPISFAAKIGGAGWTGTPLNGQPAAWTAIAADGFSVPVAPYSGQHVQHFYVNVGLVGKDDTGFPGFLEKKANNGLYEERFTFTLDASF